MQHRLTLVLTLLVLALLGQAGWAEPNPRWEPVVPMDRQIFPSWLLAIANTQFNQDDGFPFETEACGLIGLAFYNLPDNSTIKYTIDIPGLAQRTSEEKLWKGGPKAWLIRPLPWNYEALRGVSQPFQVTARFTVSVNGAPSEEKQVVLGVRPVDEALIGYEYRETGKPWVYKNTASVLSAYVNEDHPYLDAILQECLQKKLVTAFDGYQSGDDKAVLKQMFAIWYVLQSKGIKYSSITASSAARDHVRTQHVRLLEDSLKMTQANCVDGTVLWASILRKIGLRPYVVLIPGHCFLAVDVGARGKPNILGLETTMMGSVDVRAAGKKGLDVSMKSFTDALQSGTATFEKNAPKLESATSGNYVTDPSYQFIDIAKARSLHFLPIVRSKAY